MTLRVDRLPCQGFQDVMPEVKAIRLYRSTDIRLSRDRVFSGRVESPKSLTDLLSYHHFVT